jgi:hypothetical protein
LAKQLEIMALREKRIGELVERVGEQSKGFKKPPIIVIGGYALRAYVPLSRHSRDCDFALPKGKDWAIDRVAEWLDNLMVAGKHKQDSYGYLRLIQLIPAGKHQIKISLDFMEGEIRGRAGERILLDGRFVQDSTEAGIQIGDHTIRIQVPSYQDYFLLKLVSGRPGDARDIVALVWKRGLPEVEALAKRAAEIVWEPEQIAGKLETIISDVFDTRFLDSWRGTFITEEFVEEDKGQVLRELRRLKREM